MDNQYGLDYKYFERWVERILNSGGFKNYRPHECAREFARMSRAADEAVLLEPEFTSALHERLQTAEAERDALNAELDRLPAKWSEDSSLKTWFPITCDYLDSLRAEMDELKAKLKSTESRLHEVAVGCANAEFELEAARKQEPIIIRTMEGFEFLKTYEIGTKLYASPVPPPAKQEPCGYMCEDAGITAIYNAAKCTGDFSNYTPVYKNPIPPQQETNKKMALIMEIVNQIISDYYQLGSRELWASIQKAEQLLKGGENER